MIADKNFNVSAIFGDIVVNEPKNATIDHEVKWPRSISLVGHSLVIHKLSAVEWSLRNENTQPLACGTIGFAS
ncbi:unnamed protein product [Thelazia callipaeda]|uniref:Sod_Cu domain-containing protein n=1 Tax=Thelazia callipaeda TaxID=103827 RepID=A0A0N5CTE8_THECL|nr:unnamed protein product [Thelazia callipaeda]